MYDRVTWHDKEGNVGPFTGTVVHKKSDSIMISWDNEDRDEYVSLSSDDKYFLTHLGLEDA